MQFSLHSGGFSRQMKKPSPIDFHDHPVFPLDGLQIFTYRWLFYTYKIFCRFLYYSYYIEIIPFKIFNKTIKENREKYMAEYITYDEIKIKCNIKVNRILQLSVSERIGSHAMAEIKANIESESLGLSSTELMNQPVKLYYVKDHKEHLIFTGVITKVHIEKESIYETISLSAVSLTWLMDLERKNRSFQDCNDSVTGLIKKIAQENSFQFLCSETDQSITQPFIQYKETDWEFILRLATHLNAPVITSVNYDGNGFYLGFQDEKIPQKLHVTRQNWCMDAEMNRSPYWRTKEATYYEVDTSQILHLDECVLFQNEVLWPYHISLILHKGLLHCICKLAVNKHYFTPISYNPNLKNISFTGTVLSQKEESISIHLDIDEKQDTGNAYLYPWSPESGNMLYCMPEIGSRVNLLIPGEDEQKAIAINCAQQNESLEKESKTPENRWFITENEKAMSFKPSGINFSSNRNQSSISIQDEIGNSIQSNNEIFIQAKGKISIYGTQIELNAPTEVTAIKRQLGSPAIVNLCHNLDSMGENSVFTNLEAKDENSSSIGPGVLTEGTSISNDLREDRKKEVKEKLDLQLKKLSEEEDKRTYELGKSIINVVSSIPQVVEKDKLSQIAAGFRPIAGRMKGE